MIGKSKQIQGFSLIELSITLVIVGLLLGGIMMGRHLLRAAEIKSLFKEVSAYQDSVELFQDKYGYMPGDMPNATELWGALDGGDGVGFDCTDTGNVAGKETCNGSGDGRIAPWNVGEMWERFLVWKHLSNSGILEGAYTGTHGPDSKSQALVGVNTPESRAITSLGYGIKFIHIQDEFHQYINPNGTTCMIPDVQIDRHHITAGLQLSTSTGTASQPFLSAEEMSLLDKKFDDGRPFVGKVTTWSCKCINFDPAVYDMYTTTYKLDGSDDRACNYQQYVD